MRDQISTDTVDAIINDAMSRYRKYQASPGARATGKVGTELASLEWWILTSAYQAGLNVARGKPPIETESP